MRSAGSIYLAFLLIYASVNLIDAITEDNTSPLQRFSNIYQLPPIVIEPSVQSRTPNGYQAPGIVNDYQAENYRSESLIPQDLSFNRCLCANGIGAIGNACDQNGMVKCVVCNAGFHADGVYCSANKCVCPNGIAAKALACVKHQTTRCVQCHAGYHGDGFLCVGNHCDASVGPINGRPGNCGSHLNHGSTCQPTCDVGWKKSGVSSCNAGILTAATCVEISCSIRAGPVHGTLGNCPSVLKHEATCQPTCNQGFRLSHVSSCNAGVLIAGTCVGDSCNTNASPTNGGPGDCPMILNHGSTCKPSCNLGWTLSGVSNCHTGVLTTATCIENRCICINGNGAIGRACLQPGIAKCISCYEGFHSNGDSCSENICTCVHGGAAKNDACPKHGVPKCINCNGGFHADGDRCSENKCTCMSGIAATGASCIEDGSTKCIRCHAGFHGNGDGCSENKCQCNHGIGANGISCSTTGAPKCIKCDQGFHIDGDDCIENMCTCINGVAADGILCPQNGLARCNTCDTGYHADGYVCSENQCTCDNGVSAHGITCSDNGMAKCAKCDTGFHIDGKRCVGNSCDGNVSPDNGGLGTCLPNLAHGSTCQPICNAGWIVSGVSSCHAGILKAATCIGNPCPVSGSPTHEDSGNCPSVLNHGSICQPVCRPGWIISGVTRCNAGILNEAICVGLCPSKMGVGCFGFDFETCLKSSDGSGTRWHGGQCAWSTDGSEGNSPAISCAPAPYLMDKGLSNYQIASCETSKTVSPTTFPTTASPTTASPTTASPTTASPTTLSPTTSPTTASPTTASPTLPSSGPITGISENDHQSVYIYSSHLPAQGSTIAIMDTNTKYDTKVFEVTSVMSNGKGFSINVHGLGTLEASSIGMSGKWMTMSNSQILHFSAGNLAKNQILVLSVDHISGHEGMYFNFHVSSVDKIVGNTSWSGSTFHIRKEKTGDKFLVKIWRHANGGSYGDGHGRRNRKSAKNQWVVGDIVTFVDFDGNDCDNKTKKSATESSIKDKVHCDASEPPYHGQRGDCTSHLASGSTCLPRCDDGYVASGKTRCEEERLIPALCIRTEAISEPLVQSTGMINGFSQNGQHSVYVYSSKSPVIGATVLITGTKTKYDHRHFKVISMGDHGNAFAIATGELGTLETYGTGKSGNWLIVKHKTLSHFDGCTDFDWVDIQNYACSEYGGCQDVKRFGVNGVSAIEACCLCGGGNKDDISLSQMHQRRISRGLTRGVRSASLIQGFKQHIKRDPNALNPKPKVERYIPGNSNQTIL